MESLLIISSTGHQLRVRSKNIANPAHSVNQALTRIGVDLVTQQPNKSIKRIDLDIAIDTPDGFDQGDSSYDCPGTEYEFF
jgi:hypothetical protein